VLFWTTWLRRILREAPADTELLTDLADVRGAELDDASNTTRGLLPTAARPSDGIIENLKG
jgi:hypothetical protein